MEKLVEDIVKEKFTTGANFSYNLDRELRLISSSVDPTQLELLKSDFNRYLEKGKFVVLNTFAGGILFLKVSEPIEKIRIESRTGLKDFEASVTNSRKEDLKTLNTSLTLEK